MPLFSTVLLSVRRWMQHLGGLDKPMYMIVKRNGLNHPLYLECEMSPDGNIILAYRWTKNPARATVFKDDQKTRIEINNKMPDKAFWYAIIDVPLYGKPDLTKNDGG